MMARLQFFDLPASYDTSRVNVRGAILSYVFPLLSFFLVRLIQEIMLDRGQQGIGVKLMRLQTCVGYDYDVV